MKPETAAALARGWSRLYTLALGRERRERRRAEIESDLWESLADADASRQIFARFVRGAFDDIAWSAGQLDRASRNSLWWTVGSLIALSSVVLWLTWTPDGRVMRESPWGWPLALILHNLGLVAFIGLRTAIDLRLTSRVFGSVRVSRLVRQLTPATTGAAVVVIGSGLALFMADAASLLGNRMIQLKLGLLAMALLNAWWLHAIVLRHVDPWDTAEVAPPAARIAGWLSMSLWAALIVASMVAPFWPGWR